MYRIRGVSANRVVLLTVGMVALAGIVVSAASYVHARNLSSDYSEAMKGTLRQKGLAYGQTAQSLLEVVQDTSPETFSVLVAEAADNPEALVASFNADERGLPQDDLLALGVWIGSPNAPSTYSELFWHDLAVKGGNPEAPEVAALVKETATTHEPATRIDKANEGLLYSLALDVAPDSRVVVVVTLDASQEFAFISAKEASSTRTAIIFAVGSILFVGIVAGGLSIALSRSLTTRKIAEEAMRVSELRYRALAELAPVAVFRTDADGRTLYGNKMAQELLGFAQTAASGVLWTDRIHPEQRDSIRADWDKARRAGTTFEAECRLPGHAGSEIWIQALLTPELGPAGTQVGYVGTAADITGRIAIEEDLREQARRDRLTGLLNHAAIMDDLQSMISSGAARKIALAMVDVDDMKSMNDTYGHPIGDQALQAAARVLKRSDAIVGRYGGDEFIVLLPDGDRKKVAEYRREVFDDLADVGLVDVGTGSHVPLAITMGFSFYPDEAESAADLIRLADTAMYAERRERSVARASSTRPSAAEDRAAEMIGEIVPLLTSNGDTRSKLQSVAHRLLVGLGYDGVTIVLFSALPGGPAQSSTVARVEEQLVHLWDEEQGREGDVSGLRELLEKVQRPFIIDDLSADERLSPRQRTLLAEAKLRSGLVVPMLRQGQTLGALAVGSKQEGKFGPDDARLLSAVSGQVTAIVQIAGLVEELQSTSAELRDARKEAVVLLAAAAEAYDPTTGRHLQSVRTLTEALARELGHDESEAEAIGLAAVLHDIGKIRVPDAILRNPNDLSLQQWETMKRHTTWGADFLAGRSGFELAASVAKGHHERWDGTGYPHGLKGDEIPEAATIVAVADSFDAITHNRPYRAAESIEWAVGEIASYAGTQFSPRAVEALVRLQERGELGGELADQAA